MSSVLSSTSNGVYSKNLATSAISVVNSTNVRFWTGPLVLSRGRGRKAGNIVDPDQTAPKEQSNLGLHCLFRISVKLLCITMVTYWN